MKITLSNSDGKLFATVSAWDLANLAARAIFKRNYWSDLYYHIIFDDGNEVAGSIDLEPYSFHAPKQKELFTQHLKTFWSNVSKSEPKPYLSEQDINYCKQLLKYLPAN